MPVKIDCKWEKVSFQDNNVPIERSSHGISEIDGIVYVFGGEDYAKVPVDSSVYALDISNQDLKDGSAVWKKIESSNTSPIPRVAHAQATIGNRIYIFGGQSVGTVKAESVLNDLHYFDVKTEAWTEVTIKGGDVPSPRSFHAMASVGSSLFIFGGCGDHGRLSDLHEFDTNSLCWREHDNKFKVDEDGNEEAIKIRGGACLVASSCGTKLFLLGGFDGEEMGDIHVYDLKEKVWTYLKDLKLPKPRSVCVYTGLQVDGHGSFITVFGGEIDPCYKGNESGGGFSNELILINDATLEMTTTNPLNDDIGSLKRGWSSGTSLSTDRKDQLIVFGGLTGTDDNPKRLNDLWIGTISVK